MKVTIIGTGYVGLVTGTCFAEIGHEVVCVDIDAAKVARMREGVSPIYEHGLEAMMKSNIKAGRLSFSTDYTSVSDASSVFLAVGTPSADNGEADLKYLFSACDGIAPFLKDGSVVVVKSTVPVGTGAKVEAHLKTKTKVKFSVVNNPEFLKEGSAVEDFMKPERIVIGTSDETAAAVMEELYAYFNKPEKRTIRMSNLSAEMTKYAANCFLAVKITFMNEIAQLCDLMGADVEEVKHGIATDSRIGNKFLNPGPGYGGSCFPKDVKALIHTAQQQGSHLQIVEATESANAAQKKYIAGKVLKHYGSSLTGKTFALWGVAFKANTDDIRETPAIATATALVNAGARVRFYDPEAAANFSSYMTQLGIAAEAVGDKFEVLKGADALIVMTEWSEFKNPELSKIKTLLKAPVIFDGRNLFNTQEVLKSGFTYFAIGKKIS
ncbi:MAG: UDP-glucose dehydrogenase family protein [Bacteriovoracia bacterium]